MPTNFLTQAKPTLLGESAAIVKLRAVLAKIAPKDLNVLVSGESGVGKDVTARLIHAMSPRSEQPFVAVNCSAIPKELLESELFGHRKGSFTGAINDHTGFFEQANNGTLFLDELTEAPLSLQVKLLRTLETGQIRRVGDQALRNVDVRVITATNLPVSQAVHDGLIRQDIYYRLAHFEVHIPPLRSRANDITLLSKHFLSELNERFAQSKNLTAASMDYLAARQWPGNVRELKHALKMAYVLADGHIEPHHFPAEIFNHRRADLTDDSTGVSIPIGTSLAGLEQRLILDTLDFHSGNKTLTADTLSISLKTLYNKLQQYETSAAAL